MLTAALVRQLHARELDPVVLESDALRRIFVSDARYDAHDREYFYGAIAFIGQVLTEQGIPVIFDATANLRSYRDRARTAIPRFIEVYVDSPIEVCMKRDPKGIYRTAREGNANNVPGLGAPYEPPKSPEIVVHGDSEEADSAAARIVDLLIARGFLTGR